MVPCLFKKFIKHITSTINYTLTFHRAKYTAYKRILNGHMSNGTFLGCLSSNMQALLIKHTLISINSQTNNIIHP